MLCPRCGEDLRLVVDEPMGETFECDSCGAEVSIPFDKRPDKVDGD